MCGSTKKIKKIFKKSIDKDIFLCYHNSQEKRFFEGNMSNIVDVAREAGVAVSTVSNVLSNKKFVSEKISKRVLDACNRLNYKYNIVAASLVTKKTKVIGVFLETTKDMFHDFYFDLLKGISLTAAHRGYSPILYFNILEQNDLTKVFLTGRGLMEGAIILAPIENDFRVKELEKDGTPYVLIGAPSQEMSENVYYVDSENENNTFEITKHLLLNGHRKILFLNGLKNFTINRDRERGFIKTFSKMNLEMEGCKIINIPSTEESALAALNDLKEFSYTACITESNIAARAVYGFVNKKGLTVGKDIAVASLGGMERDEFEPKLTTVFTDFEDVGIKSSTLLLDILNDKEISNHYVVNKSTIHYDVSSDFKI